MVFWVVMVIAVVNVSLGFAAAVCLARRCRPGRIELPDSSFSNRSLGPSVLPELDAAFAQPPVQSGPGADAWADPADAEPAETQAPAEVRKSAGQGPIEDLIRHVE